MRPRPAQDGFALVVVLWTVALLSLFVGSLSRAARIESRWASFDGKQAKAAVIAESGMWVALSAALSSGPERPLTFVVEVGAGAAEVRVEPVSARLNLNAADPAVLAALLGDSTSSTVERSELAARIVDWRDADSERGDGGFEDADYAASTSGGAAKDAPFYTVDELRAVAGIDEAAYRRIAPFLTVFGSEPGVDVRFARQDLAQLLGAGRGPGADEPVLLPTVGIMSIKGVGTFEDVRAGEIAVVYLTGNSTRPYEILSWHSGTLDALEN